MLRAGRRFAYSPSAWRSVTLTLRNPSPTGRRDRPLQRDLVALDRLEDVVRERRPVLGHHALAGVDDLPLERHAGRVEDAA